MAKSCSSYERVKNQKYYVQIGIPKSTRYKFVFTKTNNRNLAVKFVMGLHDQYNHLVQRGGKLQNKS